MTIVDDSGDPIVGAVVMAHPRAGSPAPEDFDWPNAMEQMNRRFQPYILVAPVGSSVAFPNRDRFRHHVYSFSKGNRFEIELYGREESRTVTFDTPGIVVVGCNIHDEMIGYIRVVEMAAVAQTGETGEAVLGINSGASKVAIWHPDHAGTDDIFFDVPDVDAVTLQMGPAGVVAQP